MALAVLLMAIGAALAISLSDPEQPATTRRWVLRARTRRRVGGRRRTVRPPRPPTAQASRRLSSHHLPVANRWSLVRPLRWWERLRSATFLMVILAVVGSVMAAVAAGVALAMALVFRRLVG